MGGYRGIGATVALLLTACLSAQPAEQAKESVEILHVKSFFWQADGSLQAEQIEARWRDYLLRGTQMEGSTRAGSYRFTGEVLLRGNGIAARGEQLLLNVSQRYWELWHGSAQLEPSFLNNRLLDSPLSAW
jgi:hypothetical protein